MSERGSYRATYSVMLDSPEFRQMSSDARLVLHTLKNSRINNMAGIFVCGKGELMTISEQSGIPLARVSKALAILSRYHWIYHADTILWVRNQLKFDPWVNLNNENHRIAVIKIISGLPKSSIIAKFCKYYKLEYPFGIPPESIGDTIEDTSRIPSAITDPDPDPDLDLEEEEEKSSSPSISIKEFVDLYHQYCAFGQKVKELDHRKPKIKARIKEHPDINWWIDLYKTKVVPSKFLRGEVDPREGRNRFLLSIDFILRPSKLADIIEGKYIDGKDGKKLSWADRERLANKKNVRTD